MIFYNDVALTALRIDEIKKLLKDKTVGGDMFKEALKIGWKRHRLELENSLLDLASLEGLPEGNKKLLDDFILNQTKLILPPRT